MATVNNIRKNKTDHSGDKGSLDIASGYATNANPGPETLLQHFIPFVNVNQLRLYYMGGSLRAPSVNISPRS